MSAITDVGVNFKMTGMEEFENRLKTLESQFKSLSETITKTPQADNQFQKMTSAAQKASEKIVSYMGAAKAAILAVMTAKAGSSAFDWAIGNKATADAKGDLGQYVTDPAVMKSYEDAMSRIRKEHQFSKAELYKGAYQIDSALSTKSIEERVKTFEQIAFYARLTGKDFVEAAKLYKQFLAAFGEQIPLDKQKTFAEDTLGMLFKIGQITKSDPQQVADAVGQAAQTYMQLKMSQARMFAEIATITPMLGGRPEMAATALRSLYPEAGGAAGKLAAKQYEEAFVRGQAMDNRGVRSTNWGSMRNLEVAAAEGNEQAKKDLGELKRNAERYEKDMKAEIQQLVNTGNIEGVWKRVGDLVEQNKKHPFAAENLKDAFGLERMNVALGLIDFYRKGDIQRLIQEFEGARGQEAIDARRRVDSQNLPHLWGLVKQGAEDLSASLRAIFYEPMKMLLEEWKGVFKQLEGDMGGEGGVKRLKEWSSSLTTGLRQGYYGQENLAPDNRSAAQMFQDFMSGLTPEDWKAAGQKIGSAANDFVTAAKQLKEIIGGVHGLMQSLGVIKPVIAGTVAAMATPGPLAAKIAVGLGTAAWVGMNEVDSKLSPEQKQGFFEGYGMTPEGTSTAPLKQQESQFMRAWRPVPNPVEMGFTPPGFGMGDINVNLKTTVMVDGKELKSEISDEVVEKTVERIEGSMDRRRANATDWGHVGGY